MPDIATFWDPSAQSGDWSITSNDLTTDNGLATAVTISLGTNRRADSADPLPTQDTDPRGWWGDIPANGGAPARWGCKFWLRRRATMAGDIANILISDAQQALQWLVDDGVAASVVVTAQQQTPPSGTVLLNIAINRNSANGSASPIFTTSWAVTVQ